MEGKALHKRQGRIHTYIYGHQGAFSLVRGQTECLVQERGFSPKHAREFACERGIVIKGQCVVVNMLRCLYLFLIEACWPDCWRIATGQGILFGCLELFGNRGWHSRWYGLGIDCVVSHKCGLPTQLRLSLESRSCEVGGRCMGGRGGRGRGLVFTFIIERYNRESGRVTGRSWTQIGPGIVNAGRWDAADFSVLSWPGDEVACKASEVVASITSKIRREKVAQCT